MNRSIAVLSVIFCLSAASLQAQISDDFNDGVLDTGLWSTYLPNFGNAGLSEGGGTLSFLNGAILTSQQSWAAPTIEGRFNIYGWNYDRFKVLFRSDGEVSDNWQAPYGGVGVQFTLSSNPDFGAGQTIQIRDFKNDGLPGSILATASYPLNQSQFHEFKIVDDGYNISIYMDGGTTPVLTHGTSLDYGDLVEFSNREQASGSGPPPYNMDLDYINIIPEPTTFALLGMGLLSLWSVRRSYSSRI